MPTPPRTWLRHLTQATHTVAVGADPRRLRLKRNACTPELWVYLPKERQPQRYPLLGDRTFIGRSSRNCQVVIPHPLVSQVHALIQQTPAGRGFDLEDQNSTNGIYLRGRKIRRCRLRHGQTFTLGPPELEDAVRLRVHWPAPLPLRIAQYGAYGTAGLAALGLTWLAIEWFRIDVEPLPATVQGPIIVLARDGRTPLRSPWQKDHRELSRLRDFSSYLPQAVIASEDSRFYWHPGVDPLGVLRAAVINTFSGEVREGASTITQQLARSLFRTYVGTEDSLGRKLREAVVALKLEAVYGKETVLLTYLNRVYLGSAGYGFEDAAQFYFAKSARDLSLAEAATLVGMLPAPNAFNPIRDYETALGLRNRVIERMAAQGMVTPEDAQRARRSRIEISPTAQQQFRQTLAPYLYDQSVTEMEGLMGRSLAQEGNFVLETTLDADLQRAADQTLAQTLAEAGPTYGFSQGAIVVLDAETGGILAQTGGANYWETQFNRAMQAQRQPGSTFKVLVYAAALEQGISPARTYSCAALNWGGVAYQGCRSGGGALDLGTGLAHSENVIALRLAQDVGLTRVVSLGQRLGIQSPLKPVPGLVLGQSEVSLLEMTGAFGALADQGRYHPPHIIRRIRDASDCQTQGVWSTCRVVYDSQSLATQNTQALAPAVAATLTQLLQRVVQEGTGRPAYLGRGEAGKTGTTNDNRDLWFIGYIPGQMAAGVWLGNDDNHPTRGHSGLAAQTWGRLMRQAKPSG
ncbi:MAG: transglycosylase domain-containing protein [Gloeomargaritaceae cyanobacterium C42_A2020_066]|nr:transglycosylase domain-containing protein [Gloeomargaritaceae cyanobacterium C42_A2020_066]